MSNERRLLAAAVLIPVLFVLGACGGSSSPTTSGSSPETTTPGTSAGSRLTLDAVKAATSEWLADTSAGAPGTCPVARWDTNSTGAEGYQTTLFRQLDCYDQDGALKLADLVVYVEFPDSREVDRFISGRVASTAAYLTDGTALVAQDTFNEAFDYEALLSRIKSSCGCGDLHPAS